MLSSAHKKGVEDALQRFGVKTSGWVSNIGSGLFGQPGRVFREGPATFRPGGALSHENVWWPSTKGLTGIHKAMPWIQRASTIALPLQAMSMMKQHPEESTLTKGLGAAGSIAGMMYGFPALGILGGPMLGSLGGRVGTGIGHLLSGKPQDPYQ